MRNLRGYLLIEWKLLLRGPIFWICCLLCGVVFYLFSKNSPSSHNIGQQAMDRSMFLFVLFLMGLLLSMHAARRDFTTRNGLISGALPVRQWQLHAARIVGLSLPLTVLALVPACLFALSVFREGIPIAEAMRGIAALASSVVPVWLVVVMGYATGSLSNKRWIYLIGLAGFIGATYLLQFLVLQRFPGLWLGLLDFTQLDFFTTRLYSSQWGFMQDELFWLHRASYLGLLLTVSFVLVIVSMRRRKEKRGFAVQCALAGIMAVLTFGVAYSYIHVALGRMEAVREELDFYRGTYEATYYTKDGEEIVSEMKQREEGRRRAFEGLAAERYDLAVYPEKDHRVKIEASLHMMNGTGQALERFPLTLRHLYTISSVRIDDAEAKYEWEPGRDYVWVVPAAPIAENKEVKLELTYDGKVDGWRYPGFTVGQYARVALIDADRMLLPGTFGWFPIPGIYPLTAMYETYFNTGIAGERNEEVLADNKFTLPPADYRVRVISEHRLNIVPAVGTILSSGFNGPSYETVLQAQQAPGFTLAAGPLRKISAASELDLSMVVDRWWIGREAELRLADIAKQTESIQRILPELWPRSEGEAADRMWPAALTLMMSDSTSHRGWTGPNAVYQPELDNASGLVNLTDRDLAAYNRQYFSSTWTGMLLDHYMGKQVLRAQGFSSLLSAYSLAVLEPTREQSLQTFKDNLNLVVASLMTGNNLYWEYIEFFEQSTDEEFKQLLKDYYELASDDSLSYRDYMEKERALVASRTRGSR